MHALPPTSSDPKKVAIIELAVKLTINFTDHLLVSTVYIQSVRSIIWGRKGKKE